MFNVKLTKILHTIPTVTSLFLQPHISRSKRAHFAVPSYMVTKNTLPGK
jgi:hypothetical protein